jgi:hypothetical protein
VSGVLQLLLARAGVSSGVTVIQSFTATGEWVCPTGVTEVEYLVVAGGGGGGWAGGGGAGGFRTGTGLSVTSGTSYTITVGAGGAGVVSNSSEVEDRPVGTHLLLAHR